MVKNKNKKKKTQLETKTSILKTKVKAPVATVIILFVIIISGGIVALNFLPATSGSDVPKPPPPPLGVCRYGISLLGEPGETKNISQASCAKKLDTDPITGKRVPMPMLWCPGDGDCDCSRSDAHKYSKLTSIVSGKDFYNTMFNSFYWGDLTEIDRMVVLVLMMEWHSVASLDCECGLRMTLTKKISEFEDKNGDPITLMEYDTEGSRSDRCEDGICATPGFMRDVIKMLNEVTIYNPTTTECDGLPAGCRITEGFAVSGHTDESAHYTGGAVDFSCGETTSTAGCRTNTQKVLAKVSGQGFSVIRECTPQEKSTTPPCPGNGGRTQLIHIDKKTRGISGEPCVYKDCIWSCAP